MIIITSNLYEVKCFFGCVKFLVKYAQLPRWNDLRIATEHVDSRESVFPPTMNYADNANNFTHTVFSSSGKPVHDICVTILLQTNQ